MRDKCELFSKVCGGEVPCAHPEKEKCGFQFYNMQGVNMGLCRYRIEEIGFKKVWEEMVVLVRWKKEKK